MPDAMLIDGWGRSTPTRTFVGRVGLVFYEDRQSSQSSAALKTQLARLTAARPADLPLRVIPIADVTRYDYWPVRDVVKAVVKTESLRHDLPIFVDFDGLAANAFAARHGESTIVLYGADGHLRMRQTGPVSLGDCAAWVDAVVEAVREGGGAHIDPARVT